MGECVFLLNGSIFVDKIFAWISTNWTLTTISTGVFEMTPASFVHNIKTCVCVCVINMKKFPKTHWMNWVYFILFWFIKNIALMMSTHATKIHYIWLYFLLVYCSKYTGIKKNLFHTNQSWACIKGFIR